MGSWIEIRVNDPHGVIPALFRAARQMERVKENAVTRAGKKGIELFQDTTATFSRKPPFSARHWVEGKAHVTSVGTDDSIYELLNKGASAHYIAPRNATFLAYQAFFRPKTKVGVLKSFDGGKFGNVIFRDGVWHPGFTGRHFDELVQKELEEKGYAKSYLKEELRSGVVRAGLKLLGI